MTHDQPVADNLSLKPAFAGTVATFAGIGVGRFAYVPLFPAMVSAEWVSGAQAGLLGALNLGGYLIGVLAGRALARRAGTRSTLNLGVMLVVLSFMACGWNGGAAWLGIWRAVAGLAGGTLMVLAGPAVQGAVAPARRGTAGGIVMTGVGAGVIVAALGVPLLLRSGVTATWLGLDGLICVFWALANRHWPDTPVPTPSGTPPSGAWALSLTYGVSATGIVPHMVYFSDLVVRGRGYDLVYGSVAWVLFGLGGLLGPLLGGVAADRWGARAAFRVWLVIQTCAVGLVFAPHYPVALMVSGFLGGFSTIGLTAVTLARARELAGAASGAIWAQSTGAFALAQALAGFALAALFAHTGSHDALFATGLVLSALALALTWLPYRASAAG